jgi:hypothetical protein
VEDSIEKLCAVAKRFVAEEIELDSSGILLKATKL